MYQTDQRSRLPFNDWQLTEFILQPTAYITCFLVVMATVKEKLMQKVGEAGTRTPSKVTIVGVGQVGMACAYSIMQQVIINHQDCSQGLYSAPPGDGKNRPWKRGSRYTSFCLIFVLRSSFPSSSLLSSLPPSLPPFLPSFLPLFLVSCFLCLVSSLFPSL